MAAHKLYLRVIFVLFMCQLVSTQVTITNPAFRCTNNASQAVDRHCQTFAILRPNSRFSSLSNLSLFLGVSRSAVAAANGFSTKTDQLLPRDGPLRIPIRCECDGSSGLFVSRLNTTAKGESFSEISQALEGLTTCEAIKERNPNVLSSNSTGLVIPIRCACSSSRSGFVLTYPVAQGDTISGLAKRFNTSQEAIVSANGGLLTSKLKSFTSLLIPVSAKPVLTNFLTGPLIKKKKKLKMRRIGLYIALSGILVGVTITVAAAFLLLQMKKKQSLCKGGHGNVHDLELQQLSLSVRTTSDKKVSFDGSNLDSAATPRGKTALESYTAAELNKATEGFSSSNHIEGSVYHGRLNGKNLAIKRVKHGVVSELDLDLVNNAVHRHPNIITLIGTRIGEEEDEDSYLVFEYAKNGSLKDWLHGGLAVKNQFIASCYCFLTWSQRLRICLDVATALQYMHHVIEPRYVHGNIKSRNVFLDEEFRAKVGNFGLAKRADTEGAADIFAFGVVLLEVLSGQTPISEPDEKGGCGVRLVESVRPLLESGSPEEMRGWMDSALGESYSFDGAVALANLARACTDEDPALRPTAEEVAEKLARLVEESPPHAGECSLMSESSSKPLVKSVANDNM